MTHCPRCGKTNAAEIHSCTPKALVLAELLETDGWPDAADELRRQYEEIEAQAFIIDSYCHLHKRDEALLRQALAQLEINRTNFYKAPSKSICKMLAGGNDEVITAIKERLNEDR
jgi:hypothetical protein